MSLALHCDADGCDSWARHYTNAAADFVSLVDVGTEMSAGHFCSLDCCMKWCAAKSEPTEEVS